MVRERHPLKQGLKRLCQPRHHEQLGVREGHPLKQGLKHFFQDFDYHLVPRSGRTSTKTRIETFFRVIDVRLDLSVREGHPLKQGLKHHYSCCPVNPFDRSGRTSTKTRIETLKVGPVSLGPGAFGKDIH